MGQITVSKAVHDQVQLLGRAWALADGAVIERLLMEFQASDHRGSTPTLEAGEVPIYAIYQGSKTEGMFEPDTRRLRITTGPLAGQTWKSPSGAAVAVVRRANPTIRAERNGWGFWIVAATGEALVSLR